LRGFDFHSADGVFTDAELIAALTKLNGNAAPGPQMISSRVIKEVFTTAESRVPLLALMNSCFVSGQTPNDWGESEVFILYKGKGSRDDPNNYRGINLINDFSRVYERLLEARLSEWVGRDNPQGPMQFGFRSGVGTTDAYLLLTTVARAFTEIHGRIGFGCFVDLQKAFPSVYRSKVLESLRVAGAPGNTVRALASSWSMNSCKLRINSFLSKPFLINRGVKEGGINSPTVFSVVYARVLNSLDVCAVPDDLRELNMSRVYYFAFADDLALFSGNLTRVEEILSRLNDVLPEYGMRINIAKTCWLPFLPTKSRYRVIEPERFELSLCSRSLECVDEFKYLGYLLTSFLSPKSHIEEKTASMFRAAISMGRLLRNLQVTNLNSIRIYFFAFVSSQLYGMECFNFRVEDLYRAAKIFLQTIFCLPDSFPINVARSLLRIQHFEATLLDRRIRFLERVHSSVASPILSKALEYDQGFLRPQRVGFTHDLVTFLSTFFDVTDLDDLSVSDLSYLQDLRDRIVDIRGDEFRASFRRSTGLSFVRELSDTALMPLQFGEFLGNLNAEEVRIVLTFLGDTFRFSLAATGSECPFCPVQLHAAHLFTCPNCPFRDSLPRWHSFLEQFQQARWSPFITMLFLCIQTWISGSHFFQARVGERVNNYLSREG
jgi:hypothetical protein